MTGSTAARRAAVKKDKPAPMPAWVLHDLRRSTLDRHA